MDNDANLEEIKCCLRELNNKEQVYIQNQELCQELGKQKERANFLEQVLQNANLEIQNRDCLIEKVIKENERLEKELKNVCFQTQNTPKLKDLIRENENYKREMECCQNVVKHLEEKYEWSVQCSQEKETFIESLETNHAHAIEKMCEELQRMRDDKKRLEEQIRECKGCIEMQREEMSHFNEKYDLVCRKLKERTVDLENLRNEFENYKKSVEIIKDYVMKNKNAAANKNCQKSVEKQEMECPKKDVHVRERERWRQSKNSNCPRDDCSNDDDITIQNCDTSTTRRAEINRSRANFSRTYMNARKRMSQIMGKNNNNNDSTVCYSPDVANQSCNYSPEREYSRELAGLTYSPEPVKKCDSVRICKPVRARCSSESHIKHLLPDVYKYNGSTRAKSTFKSNARTPNYGSPPFKLNQPPVSMIYQMPETLPATLRVSRPNENFVGTKLSDIIHNVQCSPYQPLRVAVCHTTTNDVVANVVDRIKAESADQYHPRSNKYQEITRVKPYENHDNDIVSQVEMETAVDNYLSEGKMAIVQECVQQVKERANMKDAHNTKDKDAQVKVKDTQKKKFKFF